MSATRSINNNPDIAQQIDDQIKMVNQTQRLVNTMTNGQTPTS